MKRLTTKQRDKLIETHMDLARRVATALFRRLPNHPFEDLLGAAYIGLTKAGRRYDPSLGVPFEAYARQRITGEIIDAHRKLHKTSYVNEFPPEPVDDGAAYQKPAEDFLIGKGVASLLKQLNPRELAVVQLRYSEELTMGEIATRLDISECLVSQIHRKALDKIRPAAERMR